jgi:hypothetical protein
MKHVVWIIIVLLTFALLIQNTCPFGAAGKSAVVASRADCPMKKIHLPSTSSNGHLSTVSHQTPHFPIFVLALSDGEPSFNLDPVAPAQTLVVSSYADALPYELLRPPRS